MRRLGGHARSVGAIATVTFAVGWMLGSLRLAGAADPRPPALTPMIIHVPALTAADLLSPTAASPAPAPSTSAGTGAAPRTLLTKVVAVADGAAVQVQLGTVGKHYHELSNEIQYVVEGHGKFWLGDAYEDVGPGDLIVIPKGTIHAGTTSPLKAIAIKTPLQASTDVHPVP